MRRICERYLTDDREFKHAFKLVGTNTVQILSFIFRHAGKAEYLVTLNLPLDLEDTVVDSLLLLEAERGFRCFAVNAHHQAKGLSIVEQVAGRPKALRFQIYVSAAGLQDLLAQLRQEFAGGNIQYWVLPIVEQGVI